MHAFSPVLVPVFLIVCSLVGASVAARKKNIPWREFLGLVKPKLKPTLALALGYVVLACGVEWAYQHTGLGSNTSWAGRYSGLELAMRVLAIVILAPLGEELLFRGVIFKLVAARSVILAVIITAVLFAGSHFQYSILGMMFVLVDGIYFGIARAWSGSTWVTIAMHCLANTVAVYQRMH